MEENNFEFDTQSFGIQSLVRLKIVIQRTKFLEKDFIKSHKLTHFRLSVCLSDNTITRKRKKYIRLKFLHRVQDVNSDAEFVNNIG